MKLELEENKIKTIMGAVFALTKVTESTPSDSAYLLNLYFEIARQLPEQQAEIQESEPEQRKARPRNN